MSAARYSIRGRLVWGALAAMLLILGVIALAAHLVARHESEEIFSARLATSARVLEALVARQIETATIERPVIIDLPPELEHAGNDTPQERGHPYETKLAFQIWSEEGRLLAKSASAPDTGLAPLAPGFTVHSIANELWQVFVLRSGRVWVLAAEKDEVRQEMVQELGTSILVPLVIGGVLMLVVVNLVLVYNLRPLQELAGRIAHRTPGSLTPLDVPEMSAMPLELVPVVDELNELLERVKAAFAREQRFIDAAAHEIRTPIAALQLHVQNAMRAATAEERQASLAQAMAGLRRTTRLAEQLLAFSRMTAQGEKASAETVSLNRICREVLAVQEPLLEQKGQSIGLDADCECEILGEPYKLQCLLQNLVDNASRYGKPDGEIAVTLTNEGKRVRLSVANDGEPVPPSQVEKMFLPYHRLPGNMAPGSGLGLAIVKEIAQQHGAEIDVRSKANGQGTVVSVCFPLLRKDSRPV